MLNKIKVFTLTLFLLSFSIAYSQLAIHKYRQLNLSLKAPENLINKKCAVIITVPDVISGDKKIAGEWKSTANDAHQGFVKMGVDALFYLNQYDLFASNGSISGYVEKFNRRNVDYLIFLDKSADGYEMYILPYSKSINLIKNGSSGFYSSDTRLNKLLITLGKEIKRSEMEKGNFLIPESPFMLTAISVIDDKRIARYPSQIRRNTIAIERFEKIKIPEGLTGERLNKLQNLNKEIDEKNIMLDSIMKAYPYKYEIIDRTTSQEMVRRRFQFVIRNIYGPIESVRTMLEFDLSENSEGYESTVPIMPDDVSYKKIQNGEIVYKFYIKQNISSAIYTGLWDADQNWEIALENYLNLAIQSINKSKK